MSVIGALTYLLIWLCGAIASAQTPPLYDPVEYREKSGWRVPDSIPEKAGERILLWYPGETITPQSQDLFPWQQALWSNAVVVVINQPFEIARHEIQEIIKEKFGIETEEYISGDIKIVGDQAAIWDEPPDGPWPTFGDGFSRFSVLTDKFHRPQEHRIKTSQYNQREGQTSHSILDMRIADGSILIGKQYSIILMRRTDYSKEWATLGRWPIPLPFKMARTHYLITDTEISLIEKLIERIPGAKWLYFVPYPGSKDKVYWTDFMKDIVSRPPD